MEGATVVPTWDLFIIIFTAIVVAYNYIIGRETTVKLIVATYIAILAADGLINTIHKYLFSSSSLVENTVHFASNSMEIIVAKIITFILLVVFLALKGGFEAQENEQAGMFNFLYMTLFGALSASLIISSFLAFLSGGTFIDAFVKAGVEPTTLSMSIYNQSIIAKFLIDHSNIVFSLHALILILANIGIEQE